MSTRILQRGLVYGVFCAVLSLLPLNAFATVVTISGSQGGTNPVSAEATFVTSGTTMTLTLRNTSATPTTIFPAQVLTSFYFDMLTGGGTRPALTITSATGNVFKLIGGGTAAAPYIYVPPSSPGGPSYTPYTAPPLQASNILVSGVGDDSWMFRTNLDLTATPNTYYGLGTVGNGVFAPNGFPDPYVDQISFGIFAGDGSDPRGDLKVRLPYLVKDSATFTFTSDTDLTNFQFNDPYVWGFGTGPDQTIVIVPEPRGMAMVAGAAVIGLGLRLRLRRWRVGSRSRGAIC